MANPVNTATGQNGAAQSLSVTPTTPTVGNYLVVCVWGFGTGTAVPTASDTGSNSYTQDEFQPTDTNNCGFVAVWHAKVASTAGSPFKVTIDVGDGGGSGDAVNVVVYEIAGDPSTQPDVAGSKHSAASGSSVQPGSVTPVTSGDFAVAVFAADEAGASSWTSPGGYTSSLKATSGAGNEVGEILYQNLSGTSAVNPSFSSISPSTVPLAAAQALYRPTAGGGGGVTAHNLTVLGCGG